MAITNRWIVLILMFPYFNNYYLDQIVSVKIIWQLLIVIISLYIYIKEPKKNWFINLTILLMFLTLITSTLTGHITIGITLKFIILASVCVFIVYASKDFKQLIYGLYYLFSFLILINFLTMIFTDGLAYSNDGHPLFFLGGKNAISMVTLPAITVFLLHAYFIYKKIKPTHFILIILSVMSLFLSGSGTGVIIALFILLFLFISMFFLPTFNTYLSIYIFLFLSVVIFKLQETFLSDFIVQFLEKDTTFTRRTFIWDHVINESKDWWLIGAGRGSSVVNKGFSDLNETHNGFLEIFLNTGVIGLILFLTILLIVGNQLRKTRNYRLSGILSFAIFAYLIIGLAESVFFSNEFWILISLGYSVNYMIVESEVVNDLEVFKETK